MSVQINPSIFREYDVRGIAGKDLNEEFAYLLGAAYAKMLPNVATGIKGPVAVGRDCRLTGQAYAESLMKGIASQGVEVLDIGVVATPVTYFSLYHLPINGAIMVTGSHNPSDYNGFKICIGKETIYGPKIQELKEIMLHLNKDALKTSPTLGRISRVELLPHYIDHIVKSTKPVKPLKIILDAGNGTAGPIAPPIFERLGARVTKLFCDQDGRFPNHHPDPTVPENLKALIDAVRKEKADIGIAFDGDSDRIGLVDETGRIIYGDELMVLLSRAVLQENPGATIISEVKSSHRLYNDIAKHGGKPIMWKTGHSLIKSKMKETKALLAGEMSGHIFFADRYFGYDDAIYAAVRVFEIVSASNQKLSALLADLPPSVNTPEIRVDCLEDKKFKLVQETKRILAGMLKPEQINDIDGVRADFGDGWGLVRASNTQPVLVLRFEAPSLSRLNEIRAQVEGALSKAAAAIGHPPVDTHGANSGH